MSELKWSASKKVDLKKKTQFGLRALNLTWNSWRSLDVFPIEVLDDGFTFLCGLHPTTIHNVNVNKESQQKSVTELHSNEANTRGSQFFLTIFKLVK